MLNKAGNMQVNMQGAMLDPLTGGRSTTLTGTQDLAATALTASPTIDTLDGFIWYRFQFKLQVPSIAVPALPELYDLTVANKYK